MLASFGFSFHAANIPRCKNQNIDILSSKFPKYFKKCVFHFFGGPICLELSICLSAFQTKIAGPKLDKIYLGKIAIHKEICTFCLFSGN